MRRRGLAAAVLVVFVSAVAAADPPRAEGRAEATPPVRGDPADGLTREEARLVVARGARPVRSTTNVVEVSSPELHAALAAVTASPGAASFHEAAQAYLALGIRDQAFDQFAAALRLDAKDAAAHDGIARIWRDWGWLPQALSAAHRAVYHAPASSAAWNTLATILERVRRPDEARRAYQRSAALDPTAWWAHVNLCGLALTQDRLDEAQYHCEWARDLQVEPPLLDELMQGIQRPRAAAAIAGVALRRRR